MNRTPHFARVARALALLGSVGAAALGGCTRESEARPPQPSSTCPPSPPTRNGACVGFATGLTCEYYGAIQCTCRAPATPPGAAPAWQCITRGAPGPLPPPELPA